MMISIMLLASIVDVVSERVIFFGIIIVVFKHRIVTTVLVLLWPCVCCVCCIGCVCCKGGLNSCLNSGLNCISHCLSHIILKIFEKLLHPCPFIRTRSH
ncbi:hypothetical protein YC2023_019069 [Brassica napus]